ncbi:MAG: WGR domain-containing protein [Synergistaceae bacterium]
MASLVEKVHLIKSDPVNNNNKFWIGELYDDDSVVCRWGRVGDTGQSKSFPSGGKKFLDSKVRSKKKSGRNGEIAYREIEIIDGASVPAPKTSSTKTTSGSQLSQIAKKQIQTGGNPEALKLIDYLVKVNAHQIASMTGGQITYNYDTGLFQTPMGLVSQANIDEARDKITGIGDIVAKKKYNDPNLMELTRDYLMLVPQDIGRKRLELDDFWCDLTAVQKQDAILDGLQASLTQAAKTPVKSVKDNKPEEQIFQTKLELVSDPKAIKKIKDLYHKTRQSMHNCYHLDVKKVYTIDINTVQDAFKRDGAKMDNVWDLWHGTRASNLLSILKGGLIIPPSNASNVTGRMFGNGVYASDQSTKALNYAYGYWGGGKSDDNCFMFLLKMAMGNYYTPKSPFSANSAPKGYDSTFAQAHKSGVYNNEMIVYRTSQINLRYLVEFSPNGK